MRKLFDIDNNENRYKPGDEIPTKYCQDRHIDYREVTGIDYNISTGLFNQKDEYNKDYNE